MMQHFNQAGAPLSGRWVTLQPFTPAHVDDMHAITAKDVMVDRWPRDGEDLTRDEFEANIWGTTTLRYALLQRDTGQLVGMIQGRAEDERSRIISVGVIIDPDMWRRGWPFEGLALFINLLFTIKGFRKVYFQTPMSTVERIGGALDRWLTSEAVFHKHTRWRDTYQDWCIYSLNDHEWDPSAIGVGIHEAAEEPINDQPLPTLDNVSNDKLQIRQRSNGPKLPLLGRRASLEPMTPMHMDALYVITEKENMANRWPRDGKKQTREEFEDFVWQTGSLRYALKRRDTGEVIGMLHGRQQDDYNRTISVGVIIDPDMWRRGWPFEGILLFINLLFDVKGFRKIYFKMPMSTVERLGGAFESWLTREVATQRHVRWKDGYQDWFIYSLGDDQWDPSIVELVTEGVS